MRVCTWNVNGIRARYQEVQRLVDAERPDLLCLQEIKATADQVPEPLTFLSDYTSLWHGAPKGYSGVSLHVRRGGVVSLLQAEERAPFSHPAFDFEARIVEADVGVLTIASVYVPNGGKDYPAKLKFLAALAEHVRQRPADRPYLICGDLNIALTDDDVHERFCKPGVIGQRPEERDHLADMIAAGLRDVVRDLAPEDKQLFTWWPPWRQERQKNRGWRIDYILASAPLTARAFRVLREFGTSDHGPVIVDFAAG